VAGDEDAAYASAYATLDATLAEFVQESAGANSTAG